MLSEVTRNFRRLVSLPVLVRFFDRDLNWLMLRGLREYGFCRNRLALLHLFSGASLATDPVFRWRNEKSRALWLL